MPALKPPLRYQVACAFQVHDRGRSRRHFALRVAKRDQQSRATEHSIDAQVLEVTRPISHATGLVGTGFRCVGTGLSIQHAHGLAAQAAPDEKFDWVIRYQTKIRVVPLIAGGVGILGVLANRIISGVRLACLPAPCSAWRSGYFAITSLKQDTFVKHERRPQQCIVGSTTLPGAWLWRLFSFSHLPGVISRFNVVPVGHAITQGVCIFCTLAYGPCS